MSSTGQRIATFQPPYPPPQPRVIQPPPPEVQSEQQQPSSLPPTALGGITQTVEANQASPFLIVNLPGGGKVYAESGRVVSQDQFMRDIQPRTAQTFGGYLYQGQSFSSEEALQQYVQSQYPGSRVTPQYSVPLGKIESPDLNQVLTGFNIESPTPNRVPTFGRGGITSPDFITTTGQPVQIAQPSPIPQTGSAVERGAASAYSDIQTGFRDLFLGEAALGRFVATGGRSSAVPLTDEQSQRLDIVAGAAGYTLPGAAVFKGVGESQAPVGERVFDVAIGALPFVPFESLVGSGSTAVRVASSLPGRTAIGAGVGAVGGYVQGGSPLEIGESALFGAGISAGLPVFASAGRSAFSAIRSGTEEIFLRQGIIRPSLERVATTPSSNRPIFESNAVNRGLITYDYRIGQNVVNERALAALKSSFREAETGEAQLTNAEVERLVNQNLPSTRFKFRSFEEPSSTSGGTGTAGEPFTEVKGRGGQVSLVQTKQETTQIEKQIQKQAQFQERAQEQVLRQVPRLRTRTRLEEYYSVLALPQQAQALGFQTQFRLGEMQSFSELQVPRFAQLEQFRFQQAEAFRYAQSFQYSFKQVQEQQFAQEFQFKQSQQSLFDFDVIQRQLPKSLTIPPPLRRRTKRRRRRSGDFEFIRPHMLSENVLAEKAIVSLRRLLF